MSARPETRPAKPAKRKRNAQQADLRRRAGAAPSGYGYLRRMAETAARRRATGARALTGPALAGAEPGDRGRVGQLRRLPDPARGDPAGQHRPAPRRLRLGAALQLPARRRLDGRGEDRGARLPEGRPPRRRRARARPPLPGAADRGAGAARGRAREGQPEELDRPPRRLHPGDHRPPPPLRRDPRRLPRQALPRGRAALLRDPGADRASRSTSCASRAATSASTTTRSATCRTSSRCSTSTPTRCASPSWRSPTGSSSASTSPGPATASSATGRRRTACRSTSREIRAYRWTDYWDPVYPEAGGRIVLEPEIFYLLLSAEGVCIPPQIAAEMMAYDPTAGELRTHYAGFFDPGFGYDPARRPPRQPRRARGPRPRRLLHGRAPPAGLQARPGADAARRPSASTAPTSAPTTRAR